MRANESAFVQLLRLAVADEARLPAELDRLRSLEPIDWPEMERLAAKNYLAGLIYRAASLLENVPQQTAARLQDASLRVYARDMQQQYWIDRVKELLHQNGIPCALLKGSVLREDYPEPGLRYKSDVDFYIRASDRPAIRALLERSGATFCGTDSGDEQFSFSATVGMEFHGRLLYRRMRKGIEKYPDWSYMDDSGDRLREEGFALNLIGHAVGDLEDGGPGIRYILDLWLYRHRHQPQPDWDAVNGRLERDGILTAAQNLLALSEWLFGDGETTPLLEELADYVLAGGLYGDTLRSKATEAANSGGTARAALRQIFRSRTEYENRYPWLKKFPFLLPVAWVLRLFGSLRRHRGKIRSWRRDMKRLPKEEVKAQKQRLKRFGL